MENLKYDKYDNNIIREYKGNNHNNKSELALANRPLIPINDESIIDINKKQKSKPNISEDVYKSDNSKYNEKDITMVPVTIKPGENNNYFVLENELINSDYDTNDKMITNIPIITEKTEKNTEYKMNFATQLYVGSLTIIGLFVFFRLIQKTR
jgi:hypothetical protein